MRSLVGGGEVEDCFWCCLSYLQFGNKDYASELALDYFTKKFQYTLEHSYGYQSGLHYPQDYAEQLATQRLEATNYAMTLSDMREWMGNVYTESYSMGMFGDRWIGILDPNFFPEFYENSNDNTLHAVVVEMVSSDGSLEVFDPQQPRLMFNSGRLVIEKERAQNVKRLTY